MTGEHRLREGLKPGWRRVRFGDVVRLNKDSSKDPAADGLERYVGLEHIEPGDLRIRSWGDIADGTTFTNRFRPGQVLFGKRRAYQRKVAVADFDGVCSGDIYVFEPKDPGELLPDLLPFICQTDAFFDYAVGTSAGSLSPRTNWKSLAEYEFALPPLEEQRRSLDLFLRCEYQIESLRAAKSRADTAYLAVNDHFAADWTQRFPISKLADTLLSMPESGSSAPESATETGHWVLALSALTREGFVQGQTKPVKRTEKMISAELIHGDLLISRSNTFERVGFVGLYSSEGDKRISFPDTMMRLKPDPELFDSIAFELILQSTFFRRQIGSIAAGTSASMKKINKANLLKLNVPMPSKDAQIEALEARRTVAQSRKEIESRLGDALTLKVNVVGEVLNVN